MIVNILRVMHYGETEAENKRITLSPMNLLALAADIEDVTVQGRSLRNVVALAVEGSNLPLCVDHADLELLESAVGSYIIE